ncbi:MAG: hypothetical protein IJ371_02945 [Clostridia bacterium]|nr:hypothetical protein [Clostridia bacterium]
MSWVLRNKNSKIYYSEMFDFKYGKIQTTCSNVDLATKFKTRKMAENKAFKIFENFVAVKFKEKR